LEDGYIKGKKNNKLISTKFLFAPKLGNYGHNVLVKSENKPNSEANLIM
jgi:hypothetical protein